jgi:hypothetical protein
MLVGLKVDSLDSSFHVEHIFTQMFDGYLASFRFANYLENCPVEYPLNRPIDGHWLMRWAGSLRPSRAVGDS